MPKSNVTRYYEEKLRYRLQPEPPTAEEALDAIDYDKGIELVEELQRIQEELNEWMQDYIFATGYSNIPHWQRGLDTLQPIRRLLNEHRYFLKGTKENFKQWQKRQSGIPNIIYQAS